MSDDLVPLPVMLWWRSRQHTRSPSLPHWRRAHRRQKGASAFRQRSWVMACWLQLRVHSNMMWKDIVRSRGDEAWLYIVTENRDEDRDTGAVLVASIFKQQPWVWANLTSPPMASKRGAPLCCCRHHLPPPSAASFPLWQVSWLSRSLSLSTSKPVVSGQEGRRGGLRTPSVIPHLAAAPGSVLIFSDIWATRGDPNTEVWGAVTLHQAPNQQRTYGFWYRRAGSLCPDWLWGTYLWGPIRESGGCFLLCWPWGVEVGGKWVKEAAHHPHTFIFTFVAPRYSKAELHINKGTKAMCRKSQTAWLNPNLASIDCIKQTAPPASVICLHRKLATAGTAVCALWATTVSSTFQQLGREKHAAQVQNRTGAKATTARGWQEGRVWKCGSCTW